jgi:hypothetical protein
MRWRRRRAVIGRQNVRALLCLATLLAFLFIAADAGRPSIAKAAGQRAVPDAETTALLAEVRSSFKLHGKPIPPEIFRDFGDGNLADSSDIWVTVNVAAAIGSNLYFDTVEEDADWVVQKNVGQKPSDRQETAYKFVGSTENGLLVVIAVYNGGGSGYFNTLHILDLAALRAFDLGGNPYWQINLTLVRSIILGDRWDGEVSVAKNSIAVVTTRSGPADDSGVRRTATFEAERP